MSKKVLTYVSLAVGCLAAVAAIFYLVNAIQVATNYNWVDGEIKTTIYEILIVITLLCATVGYCLGGVRIIKAFLDKKDVNYSYFALPMATYFAAKIIFAGIYLGFWELGDVGTWIFAALAIGGLVLVLLPVLGKTDEKNSKLVALIAAIAGFVLSLVDLINAGGVNAAALVFVMFMFACVAAIYVTYVFTEYNNAPKSEAKEEKAVEAKEEATEADSEDKAE